MTKKRLYIQTISTNWTEFKADSVLLLGLVKENKEKARHSHFLKFLFSKPHSTYLVFTNTQADTSQNQKSAFFAKEIFLTKKTGPECLSFSYTTFQNLKQHS
jgi:hypothetical protein